MITIPSLKELLAAGTHFGQKTSRWHPKMSPFLFGTSKGVHIINLEQTREKLVEAAEFVLNLSMRGGVVLFVGTKRQAQAAIEAAAKKSDMPFVTGRWIGGLFTNFGTVLELLKKLEKLETEKESGAVTKYTKREQLEIEREISRLNETIGGIKKIRRLPDAIFVVDATIDSIAIKEATRKGIPVIAIADSNANPAKVEYPIPGNDDAIKSIELLSNTIAEAVVEGRKRMPATPAPEAASPVPAK